MRFNRTTKPSGWSAAYYSCGMVLACNNEIFNSTSAQGYGLGYDGDGNLLLFKFPGGIVGGSITLPKGSTSILSSGYSFSTTDGGINFYVKLNPDGNWTIKYKKGSKLSIQDAVDPSKYSDGSATTTAPEASYTGNTFKYSGWVYAHGTANESNDFSNFGAGMIENELLPIEMSYFKINFLSNSNIELIWQTTNEINNYGFEVERKPLSLQEGNSSTWTKVGFVNGYGTSNSLKNYNFIDKTAKTGKYKYRLKQFDINGDYKYSEELEVNLGNPRSFVLNQNYPNPFNPETIINYSIPITTNVKLKVFDVLGNQITTLVNAEQKAGNYKVKFNASNLASGIYFYQIEANNFISVKKMILIK